MDIPTHAELVSRIDAFLLRHAMAETRLGRDAVGEASLVSTIRAGRSPRLDTLNRLAFFMAEQDARISEAAASPSPTKSGEHIPSDLDLVSDDAGRAAA